VLVPGVVSSVTSLPFAACSLVLHATYRPMAVSTDTPRGSRGRHEGRPSAKNSPDRPPTAGNPDCSERRESGRPGTQPCLVSQKILAISSILASSSSALATSLLPLVPAAPANLVASLNSSFSCGYFSKCGGLK
jgi:hypothetical protein